MKTVDLGKGLKFPAHDLATSIWAALGIRGSGKTNTAAVIAEGIMDAGIPVIVLDCVGPWFALRLDPDGKSPSRFQIPVMGGLHGDIDLLPGSGRQVAEALAVSGSSAVLDTSMMSKGNRIRFAADFAEAFFEAKKRNPGPVSIMLEEAQTVIPQVVRFATPDMMRCLGALEDIGQVGRNFGIGLGLVSPRPQKLVKDILNLAETVFGFRATGVLERKAIAEWVQETGATGRDEVAGSLPSLPKGTALVWSPSLFGVYGKFALPLKSTYDASATPDKKRASITMKPLDLAQLQASMAHVVAEAKANDPRELRETIAKLRSELAVAKSIKAPPATPAIPKSATYAVFQMNAAVVRAHEVMVGLAGYVEDLKKSIGMASGIVSGAIDPDWHKPGPRRPAPTQNATSEASIRGHAAGNVAVTSPPIRVGTNSDASTVAVGQRRMLEALASTRKDGLSRRELGALSGVKSSGGTFGTYLSRLRVAGHVEDGGAGVRITDAGRALVGHVEQPRGYALFEWWRPKLGEKPAHMLDVLVSTGQVIGRDELARQAGLTANAGTFGTYLSRLMSRGLIERANGGYRASPIFHED